MEQFQKANIWVILVWGKKGHTVGKKNKILEKKYIVCNFSNVIKDIQIQEAQEPPEKKVSNEENLDITQSKYQKSTRWN